MALPTGTISMSQVNTELQKTATATISLNDTNVRTLAGKSSGTISMGDLRAKTWGTLITFTGMGKGTYHSVGFNGYFQDVVGNCNPRRLEGVDSSINGFYYANEAKDYCYLSFNDRDGNKFDGRTIVVNNTETFKLELSGGPLGGIIYRFHSTWLTNILKAGGTATILFLPA